MKKLLVVFAIILGIMGVVAFINIPDVPVITKPVRIVVQDPELKKHFTTLGIENDNLNLVFGDLDELTGEDASYYRGTITVNPHNTEEGQLQTVGHEYLHYYWQTHLTHTERQDLLDDLEHAYNADSWIPSQLEKPMYATCNQDCRTEEKYAYSCTSLFDESLTQDLINHCNEVLPGRHNITW